MKKHFSSFVSRNCFQLRILLGISMFVQIVPVSAKIWKESLMYLTPLCDMDDRLAQGCAKQESGIHGLPKCLMACNLHDTCTGASTDEQDMCYFHEACSPTLDSTCVTPNPVHKYVVKHCANRGTWQDDQERCQCRDGMVGTSCEENPTACVDLTSHGYVKGDYNITLNPTGNLDDMFNVTCYINPGYSYNNYKIFMSEGKYSFDRTWQEYKDGFFIDDKNYWRGLEVLHRLTQLGTARITIHFTFIGGSQTYRYWKNFKLSGESDGYKISYDTNFGIFDGFFGYSNMLGNCLSDVTNVPFSTRDRDQDTEQSRNCASETGSGWWFSDCLPNCNIFGFYPSNSHPYQQQMRLCGVDPNTYQNHANDWDVIGLYLQV